MIIYILLTTAGADTGPFNLYSDVDGYISAFETGVSKAALLAGYTSFVAPPGTTIVRVKSDGVCTSQVDINVTQCTTTSTTTQAPLMFLLGYSLTVPSEACGDDTPATTYAAPGSILQNGTVLYTNPSLTIFVPDGYYSDGVNVWYASSGVLTLQSPCSSVGIPLEAIYSTNLAGHCSLPTNTVYTDDGTLGSGKVIYTDFAMTVLLVGYDYISASTGPVYTLSSLTGVVGISTASTC